MTENVQGAKEIEIMETETVKIDMTAAMTAAMTAEEMIAEMIAEIDMTAAMTAAEMIAEMIAEETDIISKMCGRTS